MRLVNLISKSLARYARLADCQSTAGYQPCLPDRSGLEIARVVRGWCGYPHIPIVALTASAEKAGVAWRAGFSGFVAKPFVPKTFQTMVKRLARYQTH